MRGPLSLTMIAVSGLVLCTGQAQAQDWRTAGYDAQRSSWVRSDRKMSPASVRDGDFELLWKMEFENEPRQMNALTPPVLLDRLVGFQGFRALAFFGGSSGRIFAVDTDLARVEWTKRLESGPAPADATLACPGGLTANLARPTRAEFPPPSFSGTGRRTPAASGVGNPGEGAITLRPQQRGGTNNRSEEPPSTRIAQPVGNPLEGLSLLYALTSDGMLHSMHASNGATYVAAMPFLPPNAQARGLMVIGNTAYAATVNNCGGVPDGVWAINLESKEVSSWKSNQPTSGGAIAGMFGFAMGSDGKPYVGTSDALVTILDAATLRSTRPYQVFTHNVSLSATPIVIDFNNNDYVAAAASDGSIRLFQPITSGDMPPPPATASRSSAASALASWKDQQGTTWLLASTANSVDAWKIVLSNGAPLLERGWSKEIAAPLPPVIVNGIVFAGASGEYRGSEDAAERVRLSTRAVLYALDGQTGETLWDSGTAIESFATGQGLAVGNGNVYVATYDGSMYSFGFPIEH